ncbi:MAG: hypothetical protein KKB59_14090 [Spirochaetes bacterium]|nr:hypothetical protein [Spirochaetota bacterium]
METWLSITLAIIGVGGGIGSLVIIGIRVGTLQARVEDTAQKANSLETCLDGLATKEQLKVLSERVVEDRNHDNARFAELYEARNDMKGEIIEVAASLKAVCDRLERIEPKLDELLRRGA